jgi:hypothetical protein
MYGDVTGNDEVSAFDASWILHYVAHALVGEAIQFPIELTTPPWALAPLTPEEAFQVADVDADTEITAPDAVVILQYSVGIISTLPAPGGALAPAATVVQAPRLYSSDEMVRPGETFTVSLDLDAVSGIRAGEFLLEYDPALMHASNVWMDRAGEEDATAGPLLTHYEAEGRLGISFASARPVDSSDSTLRIEFETNRHVPSGTTGSVRATHLRLNRSVFDPGTVLPFQIKPYSFQLMANYPNPFNPETWMPFELAADSDVIVRIYGLDGSIVRTLDLGHRPIGEHHSRDSAAYWNGRNEIGERVASGVYVYELLAGDQRAVRRMVISK